jgi:hypothetical protein
MAQPPQTIVASNRINIPAICRIPGRGTAFLVSPGILLTSLSVVGSKQEASKLKAVFFEHGKQAAVTVDLMPHSFFFSSAFPDYLDYCLVACDTKHIFNVKPVKFPLILKGIPEIQMDDTVLIVQHPLPHTLEDGAVTEPQADAEMKRFDQVIRRSRDLFYFKFNSQYDNGGSPVFNEKGQLVGLHSQRTIVGEGLVNRAVHISSILMHLFANGQLHKIDASGTPFAEIWSCWFLEEDVTSGLKVIQNFAEWDVRKSAVLEFCQIMLSKEKVPLEAFASADGLKTLLESLVRFKNEEQVVGAIMRTLWKVTFGNTEFTDDLVKQNGIPEIIAAMKKYPANEDIAEYGNVLLYNISLTPKYCAMVAKEDGLASLLATMRGFTGSEVVYKFGYGALGNLCQDSEATITTFVGAGGIDTLCAGMSAFPNNEYLNENAMRLVAGCAKYPQFRCHEDARQVIKCIIAAMYKFKNTKNLARDGNNALWDLGMETSNRLVICDHQGLEIIGSTATAISEGY